MKRVNCWWMSFVCLLSFVFTNQNELTECCVWFQCFAQWCCTCVSNLVRCWWEEKRKEWIVDGCLCVSLFFCLHHTDRVQWVLCLISMIHSMMLHLCLQSCCLLMKREKNRVNWWIFFVFFCIHNLEWAEWVLCLISMIHSMMLLLCPQCYSLLINWEMKRVNCWWMSFVCLLLSSPHKLSAVSVVFDFNDSLNDVAPISPISLSVGGCE